MKTTEACVYLTNRFHFALFLFRNRSRMTSKCGKNKKVAQEAIAERVTDVLTTWASVQPPSQGLSPLPSLSLRSTKFIR